MFETLLVYSPLQLLLWAITFVVSINFTKNIYRSEVKGKLHKLVYSTNAFLLLNWNSTRVYEDALAEWKISKNVIPLEGVILKFWCNGTSSKYPCPNIKYLDIYVISKVWRFEQKPNIISYISVWEDKWRRSQHTIHKINKLKHVARTRKSDCTKTT